jgi:cytochrome c-type biogenesis protein CcmH/NrfG
MSYFQTGDWQALGQATDTDKAMKITAPFAVATIRLTVADRSRITEIQDLSHGEGGMLGVVLYGTMQEVLRASRRAQEEENYARAETELRQAVRFNPGADDAWMNLGEACLRQGKWKESVEAYRQAVRLQPEDPLYRADLACALLKQGKWDEAVKEAQESLRLGMEKNLHPVFKELGEP